MVLERAEVIVKAGMMDELIEVLQTRALPLTATFTGCLSFRALRGVEDADSIMLLAEWESIEAHLAIEEIHRHFGGFGWKRTSRTSQKGRERSSASRQAGKRPLPRSARARKRTSLKLSFAYAWVARDPQSQQERAGA